MGLYGFMCCHFWKFGQMAQAQSIARFMAITLLFGLANPRIGNAAHVGGFVTGLVLAFVCGPNPAVQKKTVLYREKRTEVVNGKPLLPIAYLLGTSLVLMPQARAMVVQLVTAVVMHVQRPGALAQGAVLQHFKLGGLTIA